MGCVALQVVEWVLADACTAWCQPEWQQRLSSCAAFLDSYMPLHTNQQGAVEARAPDTLRNAQSCFWSLIILNSICTVSPLFSLCCLLAGRPTSTAPATVEAGQA